MRKALHFVFLPLLCAVLAGCNTMGDRPNAQAAYDQVRDRFAEQESFAFYGQTKLLTGDTANANVVSFSGRKHKEGILMNVKLSQPEQKRVQTLSLLSRQERLFVKQESDREWKSAGLDGSFRQELNNWDPVFAFRQMDEMKKSVLPLTDRNTADDIEAVRVLLDSTKLKNWLAEQMKQQAGLHVQSAHQPRLKLAMTLSDGAWRALRQGVSIQAAETNVDEMIDQMELEAEYTVYYNKTTMLPTSLVMSIRSEYDANNQRVLEHTRVETFLQNYGQVQPLPNPTSAEKTSK
ncbi:MULTISPECIES: hypothetical protein [Bacillales]|jgi:hypothetical protein|uniref:hypothetical protein n=1 Tax=Brevibacillus TaxID=55080 RepID=UPI001490BB17|nr:MULTISPECIES: hypothetical protein [Bacillales]MBR8660900.1 hypothetical protein [Brevibacillus sp. NL20B1]NNV04318.1 hypothetical protein [Brevibacillus sp. MCWH]UFJ61412.1 hypothetical protein IRT44_00670 [Anoxybacillus sediminis]